MKLKIMAMGLVVLLLCGISFSADAFDLMVDPALIARCKPLEVLEYGVKKYGGTIVHMTQGKFKDAELKCIMKLHFKDGCESLNVVMRGEPAAIICPSLAAALGAKGYVELFVKEGVGGHWELQMFNWDGLKITAPVQEPGAMQVPGVLEGEQGGLILETEPKL